MTGVMIKINRFIYFAYRVNGRRKWAADMTMCGIHGRMLFWASDIGRVARLFSAERHESQGGKCEKSGRKACKAVSECHRPYYFRMNRKEAGPKI